MTQHPLKKQIVHDFLRLSPNEREELLIVLNGFCKPETNVSLYDLKGLGKGMWNDSIDEYIENERLSWSEQS